MECARSTVFRSEAVSIGDVSVDELSLDAFARSVRDGTLVFIRSGAIATTGSHGAVIADANYVLIGTESERPYHLPVAGAPCVCTIVRFGTALREVASNRTAALLLSSSRAHLMQARLLNAAWLGRDAEALDAAAADLMQELSVNGRAEPGLGDHADTVRTIRMLLNQSASKSLSLAELSRQTYLSPFTISRVFHRQTGIPLRRYVKRLRLRTALNVMLEGTRKLTSIATELGFYDEAHFSKTFHAEFGIAPAQAFGPVCARGRTLS